MNIYVGNLPYSLTNEDLLDTFASFGEVYSAAVIIDQVTGKSKGFGFVEMMNNAAANSAIAELNGKELAGRALCVNEAKPRRTRSRNLRRD